MNPRTLFVVLPERGHLNPLLSVAQAVAAAGHETAFFCHDDISSALAAAGLSGPCAWAEAGEKAPRQIPDVARLRDVAWLTGWAKFGMRAVLSQRFLAPLRALVHAFRPDVIALDPLAYHGVVVAESEGLPWAGISTNLLPLAPASWDGPMVQAYDRAAADRDRLFARAGTSARFKVNEAISPWLNTVFTTEAFIPRVPADNAHSFFVGPLPPTHARGDEPAFPWERLPKSGPIVYVAFGSQITYGEAFTVELATELAEEAHVVIALKDQADRIAPRLPARCIAVGYAPQRALLDRVDAMVGHGGANSVMECLYQGRPMLVLPTVNDGPLQGLFVERAGVGYSLAPAQASVAACRERVHALLAESSPARRSAVEVGRSYRAHDGAAAAAALIDKLARARAPLSPSPG
jgi:MGT family glycosyltransferase